MEMEIMGIKFSVGKTKIAKDSKVVLAYIKAMKDGEGKARKILKTLEK